MRKPTLKTYKKRLDNIFSQYIRLRDYYKCFTCGKQLIKKNSQAGHLFSRKFLVLRYDENNVNCQCMPCNVFMHGNIHEYIKNFIEKYDKRKYDKLDKKKETYIKYGIDWYKIHINLYKQKIKDLEESRF